MTFPHPDYSIRGGVLIKFNDGESMIFSFTKQSAAMAFFHRAQRRADAHSVQFLDPDLHSVLKSGYAEPNATHPPLSQENENAKNPSPPAIPEVSHVAVKD